MKSRIPHNADRYEFNEEQLSLRSCYKQVIEIKFSYAEVEPSLLLQDNGVFPTQFFQTFCSFLVFFKLGWQMRQLGVLQTFAFALLKG